MIRIQTVDGRTRTLDPERAADLLRIEALGSPADPKISGISIVLRRHREEAIFTMPAPDRDDVSWRVSVLFEDGASMRESVCCYFDRWCVSLSVYVRSRPVISRIDSFRTGRRILVPRDNGR